jgi:hypothetical protein
MKVQNVFSYKGKGGSLKEAVGAIINNRSKAILDAKMKKITVNLKREAQLWQKWLQLKLSTPSNHNIKNMTPFPKYDSGKLSASIKVPTVEVKRYTGPASKIPAYKIKMKALFGMRMSEDGGYDVGRYLNNQYDRTFGRWQERAQRNLFERMKRNIHG